MSNPTSNFGWQMPTATDLVTDLPADFAVFGQAVDTALMDLKGGTTGQVLKKNTNTDMDFVWGADGGMTNPMTTTGDTIYSSSGSTPARLGIGTTGQVLAVSAGLPAWTTPASGSMTLINSGGTTLTGSLVTISSIPATYKDLKIEVKNYRPAVSNELLRMRVNLDTTADVYGGRTLGLRDSNELWASYGYTSWDISVEMTSTADNQGYFVVYLNDYANTTTFKIAQNSSIANATTNPTTAYASNSQNLFYKPTTAINSVSFLTSSGNMTSGTAYVYGVN
jgi:hypothetical protein